MDPPSDLRLQFGSLVIDAGNNVSVTVSEDLDQSPRITDGDADGVEQVDMGAYEAPGRFQLTVAIDGSGGGTITSTPSGIDCGTSCTASMVQESMCTLDAVADAGSSFTGWSGAVCSGTGLCILTMNADRQLFATFASEDFMVYLPGIVKSLSD